MFKSLTANQKMSRLAVELLVAAGIMNQADLASVKKAISGYQTSSLKLKLSHKNYRTAKKQLEGNANELVKLGEIMEEMGDSQIESNQS